MDKTLSPLELLWQAMQAELTVWDIQGGQTQCALVRLTALSLTRTNLKPTHINIKPTRSRLKPASTNIKLTRSNIKPLPTYNYNE